MTFDEELAGRVRDLVDHEQGISEQRMFGGLAFLINGNMAVSASGEGGLLLRVEPAATDDLASEAHAHIAVMRGREMRGWLRVDAAGVRTKPELRKWVTRGVGYARSLPAKR